MNCSLWRLHPQNLVSISWKRHYGISKWPINRHYTTLSCPYLSELCTPKTISSLRVESYLSAAKTSQLPFDCSMLGKICWTHFNSNPIHIGRWKISWNIKSWVHLHYTVNTMANIAFHEFPSKPIHHLTGLRGGSSPYNSNEHQNNFPNTKPEVNRLVHNPPPKFWDNKEMHINCFLISTTLKLSFPNVLTCCKI